VLLWNAPHAQSAGFDAGVSVSTYLENQALIIPDYLRLAAWPNIHVFTYGEVRALTLSDLGPVALVAPALLVTALLMWVRSPALGFPLVWFFLTLAPTSSVVPIVTEAGATRRMYLPLIGLIAFLVASSASAVNIRVRLSRVRTGSLAALIAALIVALSVETAAENGDYMSPESLWRESLAHWPSATAHRNLATALKTAGKRDEVIEHLRASVDAFPEERYTLGIELLEQGMPAAAIPELERVIAERPGNRTIAVDGRYALARAYRQVGRSADAVAVFDAILQRSPDVRAQAGKGDALLASGDFAAAHREYQQVLATTPEALDVLTNDGIALLRMGLASDALPLFRRVVAGQPNDAAAQVNLAAALAGVGELISANDLACRVVATHPENLAALRLATDIRAVAVERKVRVNPCV
jgi:tetratricopeptide (TPR) repeat protein